MLQVIPTGFPRITCSGLAHGDLKNRLLAKSWKYDCLCAVLQASGFCYVNDIVIAILELLK